MNTIHSDSKIKGDRRDRTGIAKGKLLPLVTVKWGKVGECATSAQASIHGHVRCVCRIRSWSCLGHVQERKEKLQYENNVPEASEDENSPRSSIPASARARLQRVGLPSPSPVTSKSGRSDRLRSA